MGYLEWSANVIAALAWPVAVLYLADRFKVQLISFMDRVRNVKAPGIELIAAQKDSLVQRKSPPRDSALVLEQNFSANGYYRLYANGHIVQKMTYLLRANQASAQIVFPIAMPFEVTSVQAVGDASVEVVQLTNGNCTLRFDPAPQEREISLIISGI